MRNKVIAVLCALFSFACVAQAQNIIWVSSGYYQIRDGEVANDQGFVDLLIEQGYDVTRLDDPETLTTAKIDLMNAADLVVMGRQANSGNMANDGTEISQWNDITAPLILQSAWIARSNRWKWFDNSSANTTGSDNMLVVVGDDPIYAYLGINEGDSISMNASTVDHVPTSDYGPGTLIGVRDNASYPRNWIVRWDTGHEFYPGAGQFAGGPRMYFITGERLDSLTSLGQAVFLNAVYDMSGATFNRAPYVAAGNDEVLWAGDVVTLTGLAVDDGMPQPAAISYSWSVLSGPGNVSFSATDIPGPDVSFDAAGTYELQLEVSDGDKASTDTLTVVIADPADNKLVAHWSMDSIAVVPGALVVDDASDNDGTFVGAIDDPAGNSYIEDPNLIIPGWIGAQAFDTYNDSWIEAAPGSDPNAFNLRTGVTISAWVKSNTVFATDYPAIITKGEGAWRISSTSMGEPGGIHFNCNGTTGKINSQRKVNDTNWHHVVGMYDAIAGKSAVYIDGVLDTEIEASGLIAVTDTPVWIGNNIVQPTRIWDGAIDDVRLYNYGISDQEVQALASMAPRVPVVLAGDDIEFKRNSSGLTLAGFVADDGLPQAAAVSWSVTSKPLDAADPVFSDITDPEAVVDFSEQGVYQLTLTADDTTAAVSDSILITVIDPTCQDVIDAGLINIADLNQDCHVDLADFAFIAVSWLECNDPQDSTCPWPFN